MLFTLLLGSMCSFRFDKASKLFIYGFNKEKLLEIDVLRKAENAISETLQFKIFRGSTHLDPP